MEDNLVWYDYEDKRLYKFKDVNLEEYKTLVHQGYKFTWQWDICGKKASYLIKPGLNESTEHLFLVYNITEVLKSFGFSVWNYKTVKPDIIVQFKNRKIAIEIETGTHLRSSVKQFKKKIEYLNDNFGNDWIIVVTNRNLLRKYKKFGPTFTRKRVFRKLGGMLEINPEFYI